MSRHLLEGETYVGERMVDPLSNVLLVGLAPGPNTRPDFPLYPLPETSAGGRLAGSLFQMSRPQYLRAFHRTNVLRHFPGARLSGRHRALARDAARLLIERHTTKFLLLFGRDVMEAFGMAAKFWDVRSASGTGGACRMMGVPHPSGRSLMYNDPKYLAAARVVLGGVRLGAELGMSAVHISTHVGHDLIVPEVRAGLRLT